MIRLGNTSNLFDFLLAPLPPALGRSWLGVLSPEVSQQSPVHHLASSGRPLGSFLAPLLTGVSAASRGTFLDLLPDFLLILPPIMITYKFTLSTIVVEHKFPTSMNRNEQSLPPPLVCFSWRSSCCGTSAPVCRQRRDSGPWRPAWGRPWECPPCRPCTWPARTWHTRPCRGGRQGCHPLLTFYWEQKIRYISEKYFTIKYCLVNLLLPDELVARNSSIIFFRKFVRTHKNLHRLQSFHLSTRTVILTSKNPKEHCLISFEEWNGIFNVVLMMLKDLKLPERLNFLFFKKNSSIICVCKFVL